MIALFLDSPDPLTNRHLDVVERVYAIADRLIIGVGANPAKRGLIAPEERVKLIREVTDHLGGIEVILLQGVIMDEASRLGVTPIVKDVRSSIDMDHEAPRTVFDHEIGGIDTWWIPAHPILTHVSSSTVRELMNLRKGTSRYTLPAIERFLTDSRS